MRAYRDAIEASLSTNYLELREQRLLAVPVQAAVVPVPISARSRRRRPCCRAGLVPASSSRQLVSVQMFTMSHLDLFLSVQMSTMSHLEMLDLSHNNIEVLPAEVGTMMELDHLP